MSLPTDEQFIAEAQQFCQQYHLALTPDALQRLVQYLNTLYRWQQAYRLCGYQDKNLMWRHLVLESLLIKPYVPHDRGRLIDVGTGAGVPGLLLALIDPQLQTVLIESNGKKCAFLRQIVLQAALKNVLIIEERVENISAAQVAPCAIIISRAFRSLSEMLKLCHHLATTETTFMALKGPQVTDELNQLASNFVVQARHPLPLQGLQHELICLQQKNVAIGS